MKVLMISKACIVGAYQKKLEEMAADHDEVKPWVEFLNTTEKSFIR